MVLKPGFSDKLQDHDLGELGFISSVYAVAFCWL